MTMFGVIVEIHHLLLSTNLSHLALSIANNLVASSATQTNPKHPVRAHLDLNNKVANLTIISTNRQLQ